MLEIFHNNNKKKPSGTDIYKKVVSNPAANWKDRRSELLLGWVAEWLGREEQEGLVYDN